MEKRITIEKLRDVLNELIEDGMGKRFIGVADYYLGRDYMSDDKNDPDNLWNSVQFEEIHYDDIPLTEEQKEKIDSDLIKMRETRPDLFSPFDGDLIY